MNIPARVAIAALIATFVPSIPFLVISVLIGEVKFSLMVGIIALAISAAHIVILGIPVFALLYRMKIANSNSMIIAGFVLGFIPITIYFALAGNPFNIFASLVFGLLGAYTAWVFSIIWKKLGPN